MDAEKLLQLDLPLELVERLVCENPFMFTEALKELSTPQHRDIMIELFPFDSGLISAQIVLIRKLIKDKDNDSFLFLAGLLDRPMSPVIHNLIWNGFDRSQISRLTFIGDTDTIKNRASELLKTKKDDLKTIVVDDSIIKSKKSKKSKMV